MSKNKEVEYVFISPEGMDAIIGLVLRNVPAGRKQQVLEEAEKIIDKYNINKDGTMGDRPTGEAE